MPDPIILWSPIKRSLTWVVPGWKSLGDTVAKASPEDFWLRDWSMVKVRTNYDHLGPKVLEAWQRIRAGEDLDHWATHELDPEQRYQAFRPIAEDETTGGGA